MKRGDQFRFEEMDSDIWEYDGGSLIFQVNGELTMSCNVGKGNNPDITVSWPDVDVTLPENAHGFRPV